jgi:hypothetical protein
MKKTFHLFLLLAILLPFLLVSPVHASGTVGLLALQGEQLPNIFSLSQLGYIETMLIGPFDATSVYFSLPANIKLAPGSSLALKYALAWSGEVFGEPDAMGVGGTLLVFFNGELIDTILLQAGVSQRDIVIPVSALNMPDETGRYNLRFFLSADVNCELDTVRTTVIIDKASQLNFQYDVVSPPADLTIFPRPIFQPDSILPSSALVVVPDSPEAYELQAAIATMAGIGSVTTGELNVRLVTNSELTPGLVAGNHLIFVGTAEKFPSLQAVNFPVPVSSEGLVLGSDNVADGVIEVGISPWSQAAVVMFVGGNSPEAVVKASQAFSTGRIVAVEKPGLSLIQNVNPLESVVAQENQTFRDLGYEDQMLGLYGDNYFEYIFYASPEQAASEGAYLDMVLSHSDLLDYDQTGITVILNDQVVAGIQLSKESPITERVKLVPGVLRRGFNRLEVISDVLPRFSCYTEDLMGAWITISRTSSLHLPVSETQLDFGMNENLYNFPYMFLGKRDLSDLTFILAPNDPVSWDHASRVAFFIGAMGNLSLANLHAVYADNVPEDGLGESNILVFGLHSAAPFISRINDKLPAPFKAGTDEAVQPSMLINYSLLPETSVGYLQLLPSPWNAENVILVISGNTIDGLPMAGATLIREDTIARLLGNFAVVYADQIVSTDTRLGLAKESIISQLPVAVTVTPIAVANTIPSSVSQIETRPFWILPLIGIITIGILILLVVISRREAIAKKIPRGSKTRDEESVDSLSKTS